MMASRALAPAASLAALLASALITGPAHAQPTDLLISEYVEGSSFDKAIELFNGTGSAVDLSEYRLELYANGSSTATSQVVLSGMLADGATFVVANFNASFVAESYVDLASGVISHNGNDAYVLRHLPGDTVVDVFGQVGFNPGTEWPAPNGGTLDNTLQRRATVCRGAESVDAPFDGAEEWDGLGNNVFTGLGEHALNCLVAVNEVLADPPAGVDVNGDGNASVTEDEFVELLNLSSTEVDLGGWTLADGFGVRHTFPADTIIPAGCGIVVFSGGTPAGDFGAMTVQTASTGSLGLSNGGDTITLESPTEVVAALTWDAEGGNDQSLTRSPDITGAFVQHATAAESDGRAFSPGTRVSGMTFIACLGDGVFSDRFEQLP
jgi:hypothetical protein